VCYRRNSEFVKKYQEEDIQSDIPEVLSEPEPVCASSGQTGVSSSDSVGITPKLQPERRSTRVRERPKRFEDFEMYITLYVCENMTVMSVYAYATSLYWLKFLSTCTYCY
jgi:hypothetical protein